MFRILVLGFGAFSQLSEKRIEIDNGISILPSLSVSENSAKFGGKAANLARIRGAGYRVPKTIVISRKALRTFLSANQLQASIEALSKRGRSIAIQGQGFGGGVVTGKARKIGELLDAAVLESLVEDNILILPHETAFHYADWHSLLRLIMAVVSPGQPSHHLAQVARECGVPLVSLPAGDLYVIPDRALHYEWVE